MSKLIYESVTISGVSEYPMRMIPNSEWGIIQDPQQLTTSEIESKIDFFVEQERYKDAELYAKELNKRNSLI